MISPIIRQLLIALSSQLAAVSVGGLISYPNVLIHQLNSNDTMELDLDTSSWIGSVDGLAGIPSILMPTFMQWKGRKLAFLVSCSLVAVSWILAYAAKSISLIIMSECFHGLGSHSVLIVSSCSMSEFIEPKYRNSLMGSYFILQSLGASSVVILGQYIHWKTISLIMLVPVVIALLNVLFLWPESPSWLAFKGRYAECEKNFKWLRGNGEEANDELRQLLSANKEVNVKETLRKRLFRRDFYIPAILMFVLLNMMYWSGAEVIMIYPKDLLGKTTDDAASVSYGIITINVAKFKQLDNSSDYQEMCSCSSHVHHLQ
ncbi:hypothetical protein K1T71_013928 [Dendrolimus kikuchii]|uniref:Uncharacterized protein n=1 Tax=Dendrolimus kikuchii TaxID=765133 RepID=A0ACC1CGI8_9NEOP|nr:hypothetical protein K1T71_013928 [Dendrolimus kikuchii]